MVGQDEAVEAVADAVMRARGGLKDPKRPIGSFIFLGPTGVGKTELARALAQYLFDDERSLIRIECRSTRKSTLFPVWSARLPDTSVTKKAAS